MQYYNNGVLYIVTTHKSNAFLESAISSARSVAEKTSNIGIHVYTDATGVKAINSLSDSPFTSVGLIDNPHHRSKVDYLVESPFERTLYLDSDTRVVDDISEMFYLLDRFDIALAHAHQRNNIAAFQSWRQKLPPSFPQYNGGVVLFKGTPLVSRLLQDWRDNYHQAKHKRDQFTLRELLWESSVRLATLPPEYNIRYEKDLWQWRLKGKEAKPKILHMAKFHKMSWSQKVNHRVKNFIQQLQLKHGK